MCLPISGRPGPPSAPIKFEEIKAEQITLSWLPPKDDGGSKITNYVIERRVSNRQSWIPVTSEPKERIWTVENLMEGHEYIFRVRAQNKYGVGDPLDSEPEQARNICSKHNKSLQAINSDFQKDTYSSFFPLMLLITLCFSPYKLPQASVKSLLSQVSQWIQ